MAAWVFRNIVAGRSPASVVFRDDSCVAFLAIYRLISGWALRVIDHQDVDRRSDRVQCEPELLLHRSE
jgi:diadenosine tetraphosphate (Ap4A) HIT family hydrolase